MSTLNDLADWLEPAIRGSSRQYATATNPKLKELYKAITTEIQAAQAMLRQSGTTPLEEYIKQQKEKGR